jgi:hypothetical protein
VIVRVATSTGQSVRAVALMSFALTLWTFLQIEEQARFARLEDERNRFDLAELVALSFLAPGELRARESRFLSRAGALPSRDEALRRGFELDRRDRALKAGDQPPDKG